MVCMYFDELQIGSRVIDLRSNRNMVVIALDAHKQLATCECTLSNGFVHTTQLDTSNLEWAETSK